MVVLSILFHVVRPLYRCEWYVGLSCCLVIARDARFVGEHERLLGVGLARNVRRWDSGRILGL